MGGISSRNGGSNELCGHNRHETPRALNYKDYYTPIVSTNVKKRMVEVQFDRRQKDFSLTEVCALDGRRKVGVMRRRAGGKTYESPRIVLDSQTMEFVGRQYDLYRGEAVLVRAIPNMYGKDPHLYEVPGECLILFFRD